MCSSSPGAIPSPVSATIIRTGRPGAFTSTDSWIMSPLPVCRTAFSSSASTARPSRSRSASTVTASSWPSCHCRSAVGRQRRMTSMVNRSRATGSGRRKSGSSEAAMTSSRSPSRRSRLSSPTTTWMSRCSVRSVSSRASSSAWPSAIVMGVRSWCEASCRNRRWVASSRAFSSLTRSRSWSASSLRWACHTISQNIDGHQRDLVELVHGLGAPVDVPADRGERGHHDHGEHPQRRPGRPDPEPVEQRQADPDEVERDRLPVREHQDGDQVHHGEQGPGHVDPGDPPRPAEVAAGPGGPRAGAAAGAPG